MREMSATAVRSLGTLDGLPLTRESVYADPDDNQATAQTVRRMCRHIAGASAHDNLTQSAAADALRRFGSPGLSPLRQRAWAVWWYVKHRMKFIQDDTILADMLHERDQRELLTSPAILLRMKTPQGDCDDFTMLACSLLKCLGVPFEIITIAADPDEPGRWSHVYAVAVCEGGERWPLDASHGKYPGWEVPREHMIRYQAWDESGEPIEGRKPSMRSRLNGYRGLGARRVMRVPLRRGIRGLGDDGDIGGDTYDSGSGEMYGPVATSITPAPVISIPAFPTASASNESSANSFMSNLSSNLGYDTQSLLTDLLPASDLNTATPTANSSSNPALTTALGNEASAFTKILGQIIAPQATVTSGGLSVTGPASTVGSIFGSGTLSSLSSSSMSLLLLAAGVFLVFMIVKK